MKKFLVGLLVRVVSLVTLDKDFGELAIVHGQHHAGILRLVNLSTRQQAGACLQALTRFGTDLEAGAIITAEPGRLRIRPAATASS